MKKIFYFIASAIVALGAVACQNEIDENIDKNQQTEGVSFYAEVKDITRVDIGDKTESGYPVIWEVNDALEVSWYDEVAEEPHTYLFVYDGEKFTCNEDGVGILNDKEVTVNYYASIYGYDSAKGKKGMMLGTNDTVTFTPDCTINMELQCAFFHFSSSENVVLTVEGGDDKAFYYNEELTESTPELTGEDIWVPFYVYAGTVVGTDLTLTASIDGEVVKQITRNFANGKIYNLGAIEPTYKVHVIAQPGTSYADWTKVNLYTWITNGAGLEWPGQDITDKTTEINGYTYNVFEYPTNYNNNIVNVIVNNGTKQTEDIELGTLDKDYYVIYSPVAETQVLTEAPAAGSIEEYVASTVVDPKPETVTLYLKTDWGWTNWALYAWGGSGTWGDFNKWPGKAMEYTQEIGESTYKAWDIPASCVGQPNTQVIITGKEWGETKQTKDTPVTFTAGKDVFVEITGWDGTAGKANLSIITSPY